MTFRTPSALRYYACSIPTLLTQLDFWKIPLLLLGRPVCLATRQGLRFYVASLMDVWLMKEVVLDRQYDEYHPVREGDTVIDVGASIGDFSVVASRKAAHVFAYEMNANRVRLARRNLRLNNASNVTLHHAAATSLDTILAENGIERCDFFKIDCEGCEYEVLLGATVDALSRVAYIAMEAHLETPNRARKYGALLESLAESGFAVEEVDSPVHSYLKLVYASRE
jgi:precorrin-6B methylase 2